MTVTTIPNLSTAKMVGEDGYPTPEELTFRQNLVSSLQSQISPEGLGAPSQTTANIIIIQNNVLPNGEYSCRPGTFIYDSTTDEMKVSVLVAGVPVFKVLTLT